MERYSIVSYIQGSLMESDSDGDYVLYADAQKVEEELANARLILLLNHGHDAPYTDDGEMQCAECRPNWDYKRTPIRTLIFQLIGLKDNQIAALTAELFRLRDVVCEEDVMLIDKALGRGAT